MISTHYLNFWVWRTKHIYFAFFILFNIQMLLHLGQQKLNFLLSICHLWGMFIILIVFLFNISLNLKNNKWKIYRWRCRKTFCCVLLVLPKLNFCKVSGCCGITSIDYMMRVYLQDTELQSNFYYAGGSSDSFISLRLCSIKMFLISSDAFWYKMPADYKTEKCYKSLSLTLWSRKLDLSYELSMRLT